MNENILNISKSNYGEYEEKLNITNREGFDTFIKGLQSEAINRNLSGMINYECLDKIAYTLLSFDKIQFLDDTVTCMEIRDWDKLMFKNSPNFKERESMLWVYNGMINGIANIIDEDIRYGVDNQFYKDLHNLLSLITIFDKVKQL